MIEKRTTQSGAKALQRDDREDRIWQYNAYHKEQDRRFYAANLDSIEYGYDSQGNRVIVGLIELTRMNSDEPPARAYLRAVLDRFLSRDSQGAFAVQVAGALGVDAYLCVYRVGTDNGPQIYDFWLYRLSGVAFQGEKIVDGWARLTPEQYAAFLKKLRTQKGL